MESLPFTNRLIHEKSPYLLQHAHNPIDWYPWGGEAFDLAKASDRPIFLSIGYATCHWCHVMEKESFENPEIAKMMNEAFINIKLDREEHPEVDKLYMEFAQALMSSSGGWPLNIILTPDLKPFFAATYLPPITGHGLTGLKEVIEHVSRLWKSEERPIIFEQADRIVEIFSQSTQLRGDRVSNETEVDNAFEILFELADPLNGGLKGAPKFPMGYLAQLFLSRAFKQNDSRALYFAQQTLDKMRAGGIYDHLGGGFSRYSIDEEWKIPHFEKMLYDNAILISAYLDAWKYTKKDEYKETVVETLEYVKRELGRENGVFFSAQDADSEGKEGVFYLWTRSEIEKLFPPEEASIFCEYFNVTLEGNFEGKNVLYYDQNLDEFALKQSKSREEIETILKHCKEKLFLEREKRIKPLIDDKSLTSWSSLMTLAFLETGLSLQMENYLELSKEALSFIETHLWKDGILYRRYRDGDTRFQGGLNDYAFLIKTLIRFFEADLGVKWLVWALELTKKLERDFKEEGGAFYSTSQSEEILVRRCDFYDGAEPSGNAVHAENLLKLYQITQNPLYLLHAEEIFKAAKDFIDSYPPGSTYYLFSLYRYLDKELKTVIIALDDKESWKKEIENILFSNYAPHAAVIWKRENDPLLQDLLPNIQDKKPLEKTTVYLCSLDACKEPLTSLEQIQKELLKL